MPVDFKRISDHLSRFQFEALFIEDLGWSSPGRIPPQAIARDGITYTCKPTAQLAGVPVLEIRSSSGPIPPADVRRFLHKEICKTWHENLLIFLDAKESQCLWYWVYRDGSKIHPRDHLYVRDQPGDLFLSKLGRLIFELKDFEKTGDVSVLQVASRLREALDVQRVTKKFFREFQEYHLAFLELIRGIKDDRQKRWYASVLLNRLMFIYFLQKKRFLDGGNLNYLRDKLAASARDGKDRFFKHFLTALFFEGFAKPAEKRSPAVRKLLGEIRYLNGGLFLPHPIEQENPKLDIPDAAFANLFALFESYSWNLNDTPGASDNEINPDVLGYIFEKYINQKAFGAYYTCPEITEYLCERTIHRLILSSINPPQNISVKIPGVTDRHFNSLPDLLMNLDVGLCKRLLMDILPGMTLLDPACGSGAFLVAAMKTLVGVYSAVIGKIKFLNNPELMAWLKDVEKEGRSVSYFIKKKIISDNLYGVDIMEEAAEIAKLRLFLTLVASVEKQEQLEPLPNIDFNIQPGNSLIGLLHVEEAEFDSKYGDLFRPKFRELRAEKNRLVNTYRHASVYAEDLLHLRDDIRTRNKSTLGALDEILLEQFGSRKIQFEQATWDPKKGKEGKPLKRPLTINDIQDLHPFHWGFEFDQVFEKRGGFDAVITNPPWEVFEAEEKEFFQEYEATIQKKKIRIEDWVKHFQKFMADPELRSAWLTFASGYPHVAKYFKLSDQYPNQSSVIDGDIVASKINLFKLFLERCFCLLRPGGECGIVIPSSIYTDRGARKLRELLFNHTRITGLFCFENRKTIFEGVDSRFKFVVLTFEKGGNTIAFPAAFMRHDVAELERFPQQGSISISIDLIRSLSPDSFSLMEFKSDLDVAIVSKLRSIPFLDASPDNGWEVSLTQELNMTSDSHLFKTAQGKGAVPLIQGNSFHQFDNEFAKPKYWIDLRAGRSTLLGKDEENNQTLSYQDYRFVHRRIARNTDERTAIACVLPPNRFCADTAQTVRNTLDYRLTLYLTAVFNSFVADWEIRQRVTAHIDMHFVYKMRIPRLQNENPDFISIVNKAARLTCTTREYDVLAKAVGLNGHKDGVTDPTERAKLRAELDAIIAHLYGLTEEEFSHILSTFPLVPEDLKLAALQEFRKTG